MKTETETETAGEGSARALAEEAKLAEALADVRRLRERENYFAVALGVADGGQYRADWSGAMQRLVADRDAALAGVALLVAAADGTIPRCDDCGTRLATRRWTDTSDCMCETCLQELRREHEAAGERLDESACVDLPHADVLRAAVRWHAERRPTERVIRDDGAELAERGTTWRVVCDDGTEHAAEVIPWSGASGGWCAFLPGTGNGEMGANARAAVAALAGREGWAMERIVAPE